VGVAVSGRIREFFEDAAAMLFWGAVALCLWLMERDDRWPIWILTGLGVVLAATYWSGWWR
jgi:hypothetical protein